jgi:anti-sigma B factor antagonist
MSTQVIHLAGEFDAVLAAARRAELMDVCDRSAGSVVVLDLTEVTFIDSTGLGLLIGLARRMRDGGGGVRLRGCRRSVRRVLTLSGLDAVLMLDEPPAAVALPLPLASGQQ